MPSKIPPTQAPSATISAPKSSTPLSGQVSVAISGFAFVPASLTITVGTSVTWTNNDSAPHTVTGNDGSWGSNELAKGDSFTFKFTKAGTFAYHCGVHASMVGTIIVVAP